MIRKVLIAEDHESMNISLQKTLEELGIALVDYANYCDQALLRIQKAKQRNDSYDLLITDLYFEEDHNKQNLSDGAALITAARHVQPDLRVLVFSAESKPAVIEALFQEQEIDGYVRKARHDAQELKKAIDHIAGNNIYYPKSISGNTKPENTYNFTEFDIIIIELLAKGYRQKDIPAYLQQRQIKPSGLSSIEKRLNLIKEKFNFSSNGQLVAFCKDYGII
ncbi:MAG: response regulator [Flavihumibacter sp.]